jgi:hypothetical protein
LQSLAQKKKAWFPTWKLWRKESNLLDRSVTEGPSTVPAGRGQGGGRESMPQPRFSLFLWSVPVQLTGSLTRSWGQRCWLVWSANAHLHSQVDGTYGGVNGNLHHSTRCTALHSQLYEQSIKGTNPYGEGWKVDLEWRVKYIQHSIIFHQAQTTNQIAIAKDLGFCWPFL